MPKRHVWRARPLLALGLALGLLPVVSLPTSGADSPVPAPVPSAGCCPETPPPSCPSCPSESRSSCPTAPSRGRACCSWQAIPQAGPREAQRKSTASEETSGGETPAPAAGTARVASRALRASVQGTSPPVQLLVRSFRN